MENPITNVFSVQKGRFLILSKLSGNILFRYNYDKNEFELMDEFVKGKIILATDTHLVTEGKIYSVSYNEGKYKEII